MAAYYSILSKYLQRGYSTMESSLIDLSKYRHAVLDIEQYLLEKWS